MSKDIKFRGKCKLTNNWVYGDVIIMVGDRHLICCHDENKKWIEIEIESKSICQCTGYKDINHIDIYENDIVKYDDECYVVPSVKKINGQLNEDFKIVGNKIDNPNLKIKTL